MKRLIQFELKKIFSKRLTQAALAFLFLLSLLLIFSTFQNKYACDGRNREGSGREAVEIDKSIAARYEGILTDEKVSQMLEEFKVETEINAKYIYQNATQSAVVARFSDIKGDWNGQTVSDVFGAEKIKIGYVDGWLGVSQDLIRVTIVLCLVIILMLAPVFAGEYSGVDHIILSSRYGKTKCTAAKVIAGFMAAVLAALILFVVYMAAACALYGVEGLDCSILFAPLSFTEYYIPFNITCGTLLRYQFCLILSSAVGTAALTLFFSSISRNQVMALVISAAAYLFPALLPVSETNPLFRVVGLCPLYQSTFISLMSVEQMKNGLLYAIWAVPVALGAVAVSTVLSRRIFAGHQVRE